jgi:hypothetical protein
MKKYIDVVKLLETPSARNPFYVVEGTKGRHYVSALGGKAASGLYEGTTMKLYKIENKSYSHYVLER